jgi:hypothetical protein
VIEIKEDMNWQRGDYHTPLPPRPLESRKPPVPKPAVETHSNLSLTELISETQACLTRLTDLAEGKDDKFKTMLMKAVIGEVYDNTVILKARINKPANGS